MPEVTSSVSCDARPQIAVIGLECRVPGAWDGPDAFWSTINAASVADRRSPSDSLGVDNALGFDAALFGISDAEATAMDPHQRVLMEAAWTALERGGHRPGDFRGAAVGVFLARGEGGDPSREVARAFGVAQTFGVDGPAGHEAAAGASSLLVVHAACQSLKAGACAMALAGGANLSLDARGAGDATGAGSMSGEGVGVVVLKRLDDAIADGDRIWAVIRGSAASEDDVSATAQEAVMRRALDEAGCRPDEVGYLEVLDAEGPLGELTELERVHRVYCDGIDRAVPLALGAVAASIGHLAGAAGVVGFIKTLLVLQHGVALPQAAPGSADPAYAGEGSQLVVPSAHRDLEACDGRRIGAVGSLGPNGANVHVILEVPSTAVTADPRPALRVLAISARSQTSLHHLAHQLHDDLQGGVVGGTALDVCHTAATGRETWPHRLAVVGETKEDFCAGLEGYLQGRAGARWYGGGPAVERTPRVAFLFAGQGSWAAGTGGRLYMANPVFRRFIDQCADAVTGEVDRDLRSLMFDTDAQTAVHHRYSQVAHFALLYALARTWIEFGVEPDIVAGHSLGEHVAACIAGSTSLKDAIYLAAERGRVFDKWSPKGAMLAVAATVEGVEEILGGLEQNGLYLAVENAPTQIVLSGMIAAVDTAETRLADLGLRVKRISIAQAPGHSPLLSPVAERMGEAARKIDFQMPAIPVVSTVTGRLEGERLTDPNHWADLIVSPVRFDRALRTVADEGPVCLEIGPSRTLTNLALALDTPPKVVSSLAERPDGDEALEEMAYAIAALYGHGVTPAWRKIFGRAKVTKAILPPHPMERRVYDFAAE